MQRTIVTVDGQDFRFFRQQDAIYPASGIKTYALRRVFGLQLDTPRIVDFLDLPGDWLINSLFISSPEDSEINVEILDSNNVPFFEDRHKRNETPMGFPVVLMRGGLKMKLQAYRSPIALLLIYLEPAYLAYSKDF